MLEGSIAARKEPGQDRAAAAARQVGPILLVAAAIFLIVLVLARTPLQGFVLSQRVQASTDRTTNVPPLSIEQVTAWLRADAVLASTVQQVSPRDSLAAQNNLIQELRAGLQIQPQGTAVRPLARLCRARPSCGSLPFALRVQEEARHLHSGEERRHGGRSLPGYG